MFSYKTLFSVRKISIILLISLADGIYAGGFDLPTLTASHQGTSNANGAEANDASVLYYNPAGLTNLKNGLQISQGISLLALSGKINVEEARGTPDFDQKDGRLIQNEPATSGSPGTFWPSVLGAGAVFISRPLDEQTTVGLGIFASGGGNLNYKSDWAGAYQIDSVAIELININPSLGFRIDPKHSVGFGFSVIGGHIRQKLQIDIPGVGQYLLRDALKNDAITGGGVINEVCKINLIDSLLCRNVIRSVGNELATDNSRGSARVEMFGYGLGYNLGYMFAPSENVRFGMAYRSESKVKLRGDIKWDFSGIEGTTTYSLISPALTMGKSLSDFLEDSLRPDTTAKGNLIIPARASANVFYNLSNQIDLMADFTFIESSVVDKIRVDFLDVKKGGRVVKQGSGGIDTKWRDSFKLSVGANYHYNDRLTLKAGFQYDKTPIPSPEFRHPGAPDSDRYMYSVGSNYKLRKNLNIDAAYSFVHLVDSDVDYRDPCRVVTRDDVDGNYDPNGEACTGNGGSFKGRFFDTSIQVLSLQLNQRF